MRLNFKKKSLRFFSHFLEKKLGALVYPKIAYSQARDNFPMELMGMLQNETFN